MMTKSITVNQYKKKSTFKIFTNIKTRKKKKGNKKMIQEKKEKGKTLHGKYR